MATPPTLVASAEVANWQLTTSPRSVSSSVSWETGDVVIVHGGTADLGLTLNTPTVAGLTFSLVVSSAGGSNSCRSYVWSATAASTGSGTIQGSSSGAGVTWGIAVEVWRGSDGIGNNAPDTSTTKTVSLTRGFDNSAVSYGGFDWSASSAAATWTPSGQTVIESAGDDTNYAIHVAYWGDQGAAGATSYGISSASSGSFAKVAVEIKGLTGAVPIAGSVRTWLRPVHRLMPHPRSLLLFQRPWSDIGSVTAIDLLIDNLTQAQTLENLTLTQDHALVIDAITQAQTLENVTITQVHELVIANLTQAQTLDNLTVTIVTNLVIADLIQAQTLDNLTLTQVHELVIAALTQAQALDNLILTQVHQLVINALTQAQTLDNVTMTQVHQLVIAALTQTQTLDNLTVAIVTNLVVADLTQAQTLDNLTITQVYNIIIAALTQAQTLQGLTLTQVHELAISALTQAQALQSLTLTQVHQLVIDAITQAQILSSPSIEIVGLLRPTIDIVAIALIRELTGIPASRVDTTLPKDTIIWADGFAQGVGISERSGMYVPLHASLINVSCWATNIGSSKPPWGKANQLAETVKVLCLEHSNFPITLDLSAFGGYASARVHSAYFITEPHRIPSDEGSFARYDGDLEIHWTPL